MTRMSIPFVNHVRQQVANGSITDPVVIGLLEEYDKLLSTSLTTISKMSKELFAKAYTDGVNAAQKIVMAELPRHIPLVTAIFHQLDRDMTKLKEPFDDTNKDDRG